MALNLSALSNPSTQHLQGLGVPFRNYTDESFTSLSLDASGSTDEYSPHCADQETEAKRTVSMVTRLIGNRTRIWMWDIWLQSIHLTGSSKCTKLVTFDHSNKAVW